MTAEPIIRIHDMKVAYGRNVILDGFTLDIPKGEVIGIIGPSGGGKSVTLRAIVGLKQPESGSVEVFGEQLGNLDAEDRAALERRWGIMFQDGALFSNLTVRENVMVPMREHTNLNPALRHALADMKIRMAGFLPARATNTRLIFPAACANAPRWPAPWHLIRSFCSWTSRPRALTPSLRPHSTS